jgi:hypothetical protein
LRANNCSASSSEMSLSRQVTARSESGMRRSSHSLSRRMLGRVAPDEEPLTRRESSRTAYVKSSNMQPVSETARSGSRVDSPDSRGTKTGLRFGSSEWEPPGEGSRRIRPARQWTHRPPGRKSDLFAKPYLVMAAALLEHTILGREATAELFDAQIEDSRAFVGRELVAVGTDQKEEAMPLHKAAAHAGRDGAGPAELFAQYMAANPTPRISPEAKVKDLVMCVRRVVASEWGTCPEGQVMLANEPVVIGSPEAFIPMVQWIG